MIDLLLSDRAEERRSLFEEAAGIGLYRDRKGGTERRLEQTGEVRRTLDLHADVSGYVVQKMAVHGMKRARPALFSMRWTSTSLSCWTA